MKIADSTATAIPMMTAPPVVRIVPQISGQARRW